jgi:hypothetical protein
VELLLGAGLFMLGAFWFYFPGEYILIASRDLKLFITTPAYLISFLDHPGGFLEYAGNFLNQFLRFRLAGSLVLSGVVTLGYFAVNRLIRRIAGKNDLFILAIIIPVLLTGMHHFYPHQIYQTLGFILAVFIPAIVPEKKTGRWIFLAVAVPVMYLVCGGFIWFFMAVILALELAGRKRVDPLTILLVTLYPVLMVLLGARFAFLSPLKELIISPFPAGPQYGPALMPFLFVICVLLLEFMAWVSTRRGFMRSGWSFLAETVLCLSGIFLVMHATYNRKNAEFFTIEKHAVAGDWEGLLNYVSRHPSMNLFGSFYTNLALVHQGRLCSGMLDYPQPFGRRGLCFGWEAKGEILRRGSDFFWTIGFVNEAHHWAFESFVIDGFTQRNLQMLIRTELVRGNYRVAEKYINVLDHTLFDRRLAYRYRKFLNHREAIDDNPVMGPASRIHHGIDIDFFAEGMDLEKNLKLLLENGPSNRPAFDYLMALFMLEKRVGDIAAFLPRYLGQSGGRIPRLLEESLLVYRVTHGEPGIAGIGISPNTILRFEDYTRIMRQYQGQEELPRMLYPSYGNTFWFYLNFSPPPNQ